jgi:peptidoglycan/LPS O-acetylase OafA/YrhL
LTDAEVRRRPFGVPQPASERYRSDIQALRGLAILFVVLHHARLLPGLKAGYLGVDMFFVVSGYLITGIVQRAILAGTFTFSGFYFRRAKRLLPAAYVTFLASALVAPWFLTRPEMRDFLWQLAGAITFTGNIALWMQTGYFEGAAHLKPLLHVWSLSIEEQYYLLLPAALVFTPRRFWRPGVIGVVITSLALCLVLVSIKPGATFYLLPTRAWELGLGSLGVLALQGSPAGAWLGRLFWPALAALLVLPFFPTGAPHPGLDALLVCTATLVVILRCHPGAEGFAPLRPLVWLGDISYSLYLVHWPLLAFAANAWVSPVRGWVRAAMVVAAVLVAWVLHRWVEQPARTAPFVPSRRLVGFAALASMAVMIAALVVAGMHQSAASLDFAQLRRANVGLGAACDFSDTFSTTTECRTGERPAVLIWGDSYAMHWVEAIRRSTMAPVMQTTRSTCGPVRGISVFLTDGWYNRSWASKCLRFNEDVLADLEKRPEVTTVVLASMFGQYLPLNRLVVFASDGTELETLATENLAAQALADTVRAVRALGKAVVLLAPPPSASGVDIGRCLELKAAGKTIWGADHPDCSIDEARYRTGAAPVHALLRRVSREADVPVFWPDEILCHAGICIVEMDGVPLYRDGGHLSYDGSRLLGVKLGLAERLQQMAR